MKRITAVVALFALLSSAGAAHALSVGIGAFGGISVPVLQDDNGQGSMFGVRVPVNLIPMIEVEPYYGSTSGGDKSQDIAGVSQTRSGIDVESFGANLLFPFGAGVRLFPFAGIGSYKLKRDRQDVSQTGYNFGVGFGFSPGLPGLSINVRGELNAVVDGDVSRKWGNATVGVSYNVFKLP